MGDDTRVPIRKTYKLFINGAFVRSESGRTDLAGGENIARGSRKDIRDAVVAARAGYERWSQQSPAGRGLVLYRLAEMMEARAAELAAALVRGETANEKQARREVGAAIDRVVWYAGWCDKYAALASSRNPVGGPHLNVTAPEPAGVVAIVAPDVPALLGLVTLAIPPLVAGNAVVAVASGADPRTAIVFAECLATSDLPAGVCNIITGPRDELAPVLARHMDVNVLAAAGLDAGLARDLQTFAADNVKRVHLEPGEGRSAWLSGAYDDLERVLAFIELKTIWHPARI